ncbi:hypothetical protein BUE93_22220 [Chromobacterium amazonense]|uniref:Uncharacterized protein n=2 Tax=Chromobacterium amazonense TaxID=1382803 RepID=A0A2S9WYC6_9NEIS|nr:hypothetical protein BUE93_22220 [Chromobacterium amazonense]
MPLPRAICSQIITGMKYCGHAGECQHKRQPADTGAAIAAVNAAHAAGDLNLGEQPANHINGVRVYQMDDCDWVAARSRDEAINWHYQHCAVDIEDIHELTATELDSLQFHVDDSRRGPTISFRERLQQIIDNGEQVPDLFASTEF